MLDRSAAALEMQKQRRQAGSGMQQQLEKLVVPLRNDRIRDQILELTNTKESENRNIVTSQSNDDEEKSGNALSLV